VIPFFVLTKHNKLLYYLSTMRFGRHNLSAFEELQLEDRLRRHGRGRREGLDAGARRMLGVGIGMIGLLGLVVGVPMCRVITAEGGDMVHDSSKPSANETSVATAPSSPATTAEPLTDELACNVLGAGREPSDEDQIQASPLIGWDGTELTYDINCPGMSMGEAIGSTGHFIGMSATETCVIIRPTTGVC
jgi:hypothetical protein